MIILQPVAFHRKIKLMELYIFLRISVHVEISWNYVDLSSLLLLFFFNKLFIFADRLLWTWNLQRTCMNSTRGFQPLRSSLDGTLSGQNLSFCRIVWGPFLFWLFLHGLSQVCHRLWHHRTLGAHSWVLQPRGIQPNPPDCGHSTAEWKDEHPRLR